MRGIRNYNFIIEDFAEITPEKIHYDYLIFHDVVYSKGIYSMYVLARIYSKFSIS